MLRTVQYDLMPDKSAYTTGEVANLLHVQQTTVIDWIERGHIPGYRTPGGHRRIQREGLVQFLVQRRMPIPGQLRNGARHTPPIGVEAERHLHEAYQINLRSHDPTTPRK